MRSIFRRCATPLAILIGGIILSGCSGEETIPLKKVDFVQDTPKDFKETRKEFQGGRGSSANMKRDPSGVSKN
jgi:hypothetical protein